MSKALQEAHISLRKVNSIIVTKPDKGNGVVVLNQTDYVSNMDDILSDASKSSLSSNDDNLHNLTKFQRFLYRLQKNSDLSEEDYHRMYPTSASTPSLYWVTQNTQAWQPNETHYLSCGQFQPRGCQVALNVLAPLRHHSTIVRDTFSFVKEIQNNDLRGCVIASFDVKNLFKNIPLKFTTNLIVKSLFHDGFIQFQGISQTQMKKLLKWI